MIDCCVMRGACMLNEMRRNTAVRHSNSRQSPQLNSGRNARIALLVGLGFVAVISGAIVLGAWLRPTPQIGDILVMRSRMPELLSSGLRVEVAREPGVDSSLSEGQSRTCILAVAVMAVDGGSVLLSGYDADRRRWRATWRGGSSASGLRDDCGTTAHVLIPEHGAINLMAAPGVTNAVARPRSYAANHIR